MAQKKTLRQRMRDGEVLTALRGSLTTTKEELADIWSTGEFDYIWIDSQHTPFSEEQLVAYCRAAEELDIDVQLRIPHTRQAHMVGRYLDLGPSAVLIPEVMEPETVDDAIAYAYYGPIGRRSWGGAHRRGLRGSTQGIDRRAYAAWWNDYAILAIQVESVEAVTNIRKIGQAGRECGHVWSPTTFPSAWRITRTIRCARSMTVCAMSPRNWLGTGISLAMGTGTSPEERDKYLEMGFTLFQGDAPS